MVFPNEIMDDLQAILVMEDLIRKSEVSITNNQITEEETPLKDPAEEEEQDKTIAEGPSAEEHSAEGIKEKATKGKISEVCPPADDSLRSAINALFEDFPPVSKMASKVNSSLNEMGEHLKKFSADLDRLNDFAGEKKDNGNKQ